MISGSLRGGRAVLACSAKNWRHKRGGKRGEWVGVGRLVGLVVVMVVAMVMVMVALVMVVVVVVLH